MEFNANPGGERLVDPFEVADGVVIAPGSYRWRLEDTQLPVNLPYAFRL